MAEGARVASIFFTRTQEFIVRYLMKGRLFQVRGLMSVLGHFHLQSHRQMRIGTCLCRASFLRSFEGGAEVRRQHG